METQISSESNIQTQASSPKSTEGPSHFLLSSDSDKPPVTVTTAEGQVQMSVGGIPLMTSNGQAALQSAAHLIMQQQFTNGEQSEQTTEATTTNVTTAAQLAQGLLTAQSNAMPFYIQGPGGVTFVTQEQAIAANHQAQLQAAVAQHQQQQQQAQAQQQHAQQQQYMAPSPAHHNSFGSGESPAPPTPGSNSLGSPPPQQVLDGSGSGTSRSGTPAAPGQQTTTTNPLELQMQLQQKQMQAALQAHHQQDPALLAQQAHLQAQAASKAELAKTLKPPKKPLTPYMRFSKSVWPRVKEANPNLSVCEIGANIGKMWRELSDEDKTRYNDDFTADKVRYDEEIQRYLKATGLQASDLVKPRSRKKKKVPTATLR